MGELQYNGKDNTRPYCVTSFGTYRAGFDNYPVYSDVDVSNIEPHKMTTVYWARLDDQLLYRGFDVNAAFDAMESDYSLKKAGSLLAHFLVGRKDAA